MQFDIEDHFYSMMEKLCLYVDETNDHIIECLIDRLSDNVIASEILNFAIRVGSMDTRIQECFDHVRREFKHSSEGTICRVIHTILVTGYQIERENVSELI